MNAKNAVPMWMSTLGAAALVLVAAGCSGGSGDGAGNGAQEPAGSTAGTTGPGDAPPMFEQGEVEHGAFLEPALDPADFTARTKSGPVQVTATVGQITDIAEAVGGDRVTVIQVIPGNDDPHLYVPSPQDVASFSEAELILYNGLFLEGQLGETFELMGKQGIPTVAVTAGLDETVLLEREYSAGRFVTDPHVWFDPTIWSAAAANVALALTALDPDGAETYAGNLATYEARLAALQTWGQERMATVPESQRVMVTSHDAFQYFGRRFGIEVRGLQGLSTEVEAGMRDVVELADFIVSREIPAVFVEASVSPEALRAVVSAVQGEGREVRIGGKLFSDTPGPRGTTEGTYPGMVIWNATTVVQALGGEVGEGPPDAVGAGTTHDYRAMFEAAVAAALEGESP